MVPQEGVITLMYVTHVSYCCCFYKHPCNCCMLSTLAADALVLPAAVNSNVPGATPMPLALPEHQPQCQQQPQQPQPPPGHGGYASQSRAFASTPGPPPPPMHGGGLVSRSGSRWTGLAAYSNQQPFLQPYQQQPAMQGDSQLCAHSCSVYARNLPVDVHVDEVTAALGGLQVRCGPCKGAYH